MGSVRHETIIDVDLDTEKANAKAKQLQALIDQLSGIAIERKFLDQLDPLTQAGPGGQTAGERLETLDAKLLEIKDLTSRFTPAFAQADQATQSHYLAMMKSEGELAAMRWLVEKK